MISEEESSFPVMMSDVLLSVSDVSGFEVPVLDESVWDVPDGLVPLVSVVSFGSPKHPAKSRHSTSRPPIRIRIFFMIIIPFRRQTIACQAAL